MLFYLAINLILWTLALIGSVSKSQNALFFFFSAACFVLIAGLRFQIGYDWPAYERVFENTNDIFSAIATGDISPPAKEVQKMDFLFELLNSIVKTVGLDFQGLLFVIALVNALVMVRVLNRFTPNPTACFAVYFGFVYLTAQMIILRQSLASSFVLLAFVSRIEGKPNRAWLYSFVAMGFHFSAIMFLPLLLCIRKKLPILLVPLLSIPIMYVGGAVEIFSTLAKTLSGYVDLGMVVEKIGWYAASTDGYVDEMSVGSYGYVAINLFVLWLVQVRMKDLTLSKVESSISTVAYNCTIFLLIAQIGLYQFPSFWNRIQLVTVVFQSIVLVNLISKATTQSKIFSMLSLCVVCSMALIYYLSKDSASEFIPYKTIISRMV